jgi:hypothetical protein
MRVIEKLPDLYLSRKAFMSGNVAHHVLVWELQHNLSIIRRVISKVNTAHAALSETFYNSVLAYFLAGFEIHELGLYQ